MCIRAVLLLGVLVLASPAVAEGDLPDGLKTLFKKCAAKALTSGILSAGNRERFFREMQEEGKKIEAEFARLREEVTLGDYRDMRAVNNVADIQAVIAEAREQQRVVRVAGSQHSTPEAIFGSHNGQPTVHVKLEGELRRIEVLKEEGGKLTVRVGAGCNLGVDPSDPNSNEGNSLFRNVDAMGYAFPITGGVSHQTVGGFLMTSSAGGSVWHGIADTVQSIEYIDGTGTPRVALRGTDEFAAVGVSMGLYGIISHVTFEIPRTFLVRGREETVKRADSVLKDGASLKKALEETEYIHMVWNPQKGVDRVLQFRGEKEERLDTPLQPYEHVFTNKWLNYAAAAVLWVVNVAEYSNIRILREAAYLLINLANPIEGKDFVDKWYLALPSDDQVLVDTVLRVQFTEVWFEMGQTTEVLGALDRLFESDPLATGNFGVEIYCAKASPFWMSQSYGRDVMRIDPFWWEWNPKGNARDYFDKFWDATMHIPTARLHWGKMLPTIGKQYQGFSIGPDYARKAFPKYDAWMALRAQRDPHNVFVTDYWREMLGIN